jgi:CheY-like chemotaxis protein
LVFDEPSIERDLMTYAEMDCRHKLVLLVDDSELDNFINEKIIRASRFSCDVRVSSSVKDALTFIQAIPSGAGDEQVPGVIFIDLNMPVMSGYEFISHIRPMLEGILKSTRLVILTSSLHEQDRINVKEISEEIIYLNKPLRAEMLHGL